MTDFLHLKGVQARCRVGVPDWERRKRQRVVFDVSLAVDLAPAGRSDDLRRSVDYWGLEKRLRGAVEGREFRLLESLAETLAREALAFDRRVREVRVAASKTPAVMPRTRAVVVEIVRRSSSSARRR